MNAQLHTFGYRAPQTPPPYQAIEALALAVADRARALGLVVVHVRASRVSGSPTRHLRLRDRHDRDWILRISDHKGPRRTGQPRPHFDLVTRDGGTGAETAFTFVARIARGEQAWAPADRLPGRRGERRRGR